MKDLESKIEQSLTTEPDFGKLNRLQSDVWNKIDTRELKNSFSYIPVGLKAGTIVVSLLALIAVSQVSFKQLPAENELLDLHFFSVQATPSITIASINTYEFKNEF